MTDDQARPAASLTADRIKRGAAQVGELAPLMTVASPSVAEAALRRQVRESVSASGEGGLGAAIAGFWRRVGVFGLIYLGALVAFAAAFEVWSLPD